MHLRRKSQHGHFYEQECSEFTPSRSSDDVEKSTAHLDFDKFGEGTDNFSPPLRRGQDPLVSISGRRHRDQQPGKRRAHVAKQHSIALPGNAPFVRA
jgi:hypothetical protein